jgi:golgi-specific brefeldin A-resistance guanine nucleotide exchange factor 1
MSGGKLGAGELSYNPGMVYILELVTILGLRNEQAVEALGENLAASLQNFLRDARNLHPLVTTRVIYYIMNLLRMSYVGLHGSSVLM